MRQWISGVWDGFFTVLVGMKITWRHLFTDKVTLHYPEEKWQLPPRSRMRLFMKYEDCIGCGQCARACPVQCIHIKAEKRAAAAPAIYAANGQPIKLDVKIFDIDMSLCCYCNLCTYPCPTDCIYMTPEYEFASTDLTQHLYHFAKADAKFLTVNPKPPAAPAAGAAPGAAAKPAAPAAPAAGTAAKPAAVPAAPATPAAPDAPAAPANPAAPVTPAAPTTPATPGAPEAPAAPATPAAPAAPASPSAVEKPAPPAAPPEEPSKA